MQHLCVMLVQRDKNAPQSREPAFTIREICSSSTRFAISNPSPRCTKPIIAMSQPSGYASSPNITSLSSAPTSLTTVASPIIRPRSALGYGSNHVSCIGTACRPLTACRRRATSDQGRPSGPRSRSTPEALGRRSLAESYFATRRPYIWRELAGLRGSPDFWRMHGRPHPGRLTLSSLLLELACVHEWGWRFMLNADGTTTAIRPDGSRILRSHSPPATAA